MRKLASLGVAEPIRILRVIARLNMGGPALHVSYLSQGLTDRGYATTLVSGSLSRGEGSMSFVAEQHGVEVVSVPQLAREVSPPRDAVAVKRIVELIRRERPHILHTHTAKAGAIGRAAALLAGEARPSIVVHTFHGHVLRGYFDPVRSEIFKRIEKALARRTDRLVAVSPQVRDDLVALGVARPEKFAVVRLGIGLDERLAGNGQAPDYRRLLGVPDDAFVVGWIGRMTPIKRVEDVIGSFARLKQRGVHTRLCLVGDGPSRRLAEEQAHELGVMRDCLFLGYQRDVAGFYRFFDALILPSANEGTPVSVIEALAAERPVVATAVGGVPDVIEDGHTGFLVTLGDVDAAADRLARLAADPELRASMGARGREQVTNRYAVDRLVDDVDALYRSLLAENGLPAPEPRLASKSAKSAS
jgi:glycosyltransferase involved in cell wall biosynthesis